MQNVSPAGAMNFERLVLDEAWSIFYFTTPREKLYVERIKAMLAVAEFRRDPQLATYRSEAALIDAVEAATNRARELGEAVDATSENQRIARVILDGLGGSFGREGVHSLWLFRV